MMKALLELVKESRREQAPTEMRWYPYANYYLNAGSGFQALIVQEVNKSIRHCAIGMIRRKAT